MKRLNNSIKILLILSLMIASNGYSAELTGRQILEKQKNMHEVKDEQTTVSMRLIDKNKNAKERILVSYSAKVDDKYNRSLMVFKSPADVSGTGLLIWESESGDEQWLYLPELGKEKRISSSGKRDNFMGTDFAYEDLRPENLDAHEYKLVGNETVDNNDCYLIEAYPSTDSEKKESGYAKRKFWIRKDIFYTIKAEFYDKSDKLAKVQTIDDPKPISGTAYRSDRTLMKDVKSGHMTFSTIKDRAINKGLKKDFFTIRQIIDLK